jgi:hypothetical protein
LEGNLVERDGSLIDPLLKEGVKLSWLISPIVKDVIEIRNKELFYVISLE